MARTRKVIGQDGKVSFVRHGSVYVRVSPCRLMKLTDDYISSNSNLRSSTENSTNINTDLIDKPESSDDEEGKNDRQNLCENVNTESTLQNHLHVDIQSNETNNANCNINSKIGSIVKYKGNNNEWKTVKILSRSGKA